MAGMTQRDERPTLVLLCSDPKAADGIEDAAQVFSTEDLRKLGDVRIDGRDAGFWWVASGVRLSEAGVVRFIASDAEFSDSGGVRTLSFGHADPEKAARVAMGALPGFTTLCMTQREERWVALAQAPAPNA